MGLRTTYGGKCRTCRRYAGACVCAEEARKHRSVAQKAGHPTACGQRFASGGTCSKTAPCGRDHGRY
jgi:hypothetical protein